MKPNTIVTDAYRLDVPDPEDRRERFQRRVYRVIGPSRVPGKVRIETWSHAGKSWSLPHTIESSKLAPAPEDWPQTRAAAKSLQTNGDVKRRRLY